MRPRFTNYRTDHAVALIKSADLSESIARSDWYKRAVDSYRRSTRDAARRDDSVGELSDGELDDAIESLKERLAELREERDRRRDDDDKRRDRKPRGDSIEFGERGEARGEDAFGRRKTRDAARAQSASVMLASGARILHAHMITDHNTKASGADYTAPQSSRATPAPFRSIADYAARVREAWGQQR